MFERFTDRARRVVVLAQEDARLLHHNYIGTEHILLGLLHEQDGIGAQALTSLGISLEAVRSQVEEIIGHGEKAPPGHVPFTPRAKKVLELSLREALQLGHNYIGTEHILLGLIREGEGVAAQVLVMLGADLSSVRQQTIQLLSGYTGPRDPNDDPPAQAFQARLVDLVERLDQSEAMRMTTLELLLACWNNDSARLQEMLRHLVWQAAAADDQVQLATLSQIVDIADAATGDITLKPRPTG
jgi:ATP-dependent Clp protease ATP-binding subunit ClpC